MNICILTFGLLFLVGYKGSSIGSPLRRSRVAAKKLKISIPQLSNISFDSFISVDELDEVLCGYYDNIRFTDGDIACNCSDRLQQNMWTPEEVVL